MPKPKKTKVTLAQFNGDHGTNTEAAKAGTKLEPIKNEDGSNPNKMARRRRVNRLQDMIDRGQLSMRQYQAGKAIEEAWCQVQTLSSGGEIKERVQSSPKPDATVARQIDAQSHLKYAMDAVPSAMRQVVEHVCWHNKPMSSLPGIRDEHSANLKVALDLVANKLRF